MEARRHIWVVFLICHCCIIATAQNSNHAEKRLYRPVWAIKHNPIAFVAHTSGIEFGVERRINAHSTGQVIGAYLTDFGQGMRNFQGHKLGLEYRLFSLLSKREKNTYTGIQLQWKRIVAQGTNYVDRANGSYQQLMPVEAITNTLDIGLANGIVLPMGGRWSLELSALLGAKYMHLALGDKLPEDAVLQIPQDGILFDFVLRTPGHRWYGTWRMQLKINYELTIFD
ncbi:MAG: DUF3575 domain-containing protein [Bacteroidota bacterium]